MNKVKIGVIGCGSVLRIFHLPAIQGIENIEIKALADINENQITKTIKKFNLKNVETYNDHLKLLKNADIDATWVLTPPKSHAKIIVDSLEYEKHVLCEKPIVTCIEEVKWVEEVFRRKSKEGNLILMPAHNYIFTPCFEGVVKCIKENLIGEIKEIYGKMTTNLLLYRAATDYRMYSYVGVIEDVLPHLIYLSQDVCGPVKEVDYIKTHLNNRTVIDRVEVHVKFENEVKGVFFTAWNKSFPKLKFEVKGDKGTISTNMLSFPYNLTIKSKEGKKTINYGSKFKQLFSLKHPSFINEHIHFINTINGLTKQRVTPEDGFAVVKTLDLIMRAHKGEISITKTYHDNRVSIVKSNENVKNAIKNAIELLGGLNIPKNSKVIIKPNICHWKNTYGMIITDPRVLEATIEIVKERTDKIIVVESDNNSGTADKRMKKSGVMDIIEKQEVEFINLSKDDVEEHEVAGFKIHIPKTILNSEYFINIPKVKTCAVKNLIVSIAMKNMFGILADKKKMEFHKKLMEIILYINKIVKQDLIVVDGIIGMEGLGPVLGKPVNLNLIIAGLNPVTTDSVCCKLMGINPYAVETLWKAYKMNLGEIDIEKIEILGEKIESVERKFSKPIFIKDNIIGAVRAALKTYIG
ncbi:MAG: DUF362 domain-containing protein [Candidatus Methanomethylicia archaeon]|nr:DUF362 domain-containing protein [Candidatus Methanomethylicia archaeon]MCX8168969.1 DUF362 domain-containing protein [Candidatus Methanomethylicia archaeon]MDW7988701.1 DUF362 domain-containing protein [Nitrososphaerota archaeon]